VPAGGKVVCRQKIVVSKTNMKKKRLCTVKRILRALPVWGKANAIMRMTPVTKGANTSIVRMVISMIMIAEIMLMVMTIPTRLMQTHALTRLMCALTQVRLKTTRTTRLMATHMLTRPMATITGMLMNHMATHVITTITIITVTTTIAVMITTITTVTATTTCRATKRA
jgi:hypothetical protein